MSDSDLVEIQEYRTELRGNRLVFIIPINGDELKILENLKLLQNGTWKVILYAYNKIGADYIISDNVSSHIMKKMKIMMENIYYLSFSMKIVDI